MWHILGFLDHYLQHSSLLPSCGTTLKWVTGCQLLSLVYPLRSFCFLVSYFFYFVIKVILCNVSRKHTRKHLECSKTFFKCQMFNHFLLTNFACESNFTVNVLITQIFSGLISLFNRSTYWVSSFDCENYQNRLIQQQLSFYGDMPNNQYYIGRRFYEMEL